MRKLAALAATAVGVGGIALLTPAMAGAQPPYPISPPPTGASGSCVVGGSVSGTGTGFAPDTTVTYPGGSGTTNAVGELLFTIACSDPHYSINGGALQTGVYGNNTIDFDGTATGDFSHTFVYTLDILSTSVAPTTPTTPSSSATVPTTPVKTVSSPSASSSSGLAVTGADIALMVGGGIVLIAVGTSLIVAVNRRRAARS